MSKIAEKQSSFKSGEENHRQPINGKPPLRNPLNTIPAILLPALLLVVFLAAPVSRAHQSPPATQDLTNAQAKELISFVEELHSELEHIAVRQWRKLDSAAAREALEREIERVERDVEALEERILIEFVRRDCSMSYLLEEARAYCEYYRGAFFSALDSLEGQAARDALLSAVRGLYSDVREMARSRQARLQRDERDSALCAAEASVLEELIDIADEVLGLLE